MEPPPSHVIPDDENDNNIPPMTTEEINDYQVVAKDKLLDAMESPIIVIE
jgi:hypothetical protein